MADDYVVKSKVKELAKMHGFRMSADAITAASKLVEEAIRKAAWRAKSNNRKTIMGQDI